MTKFLNKNPIEAQQRLTYFIVYEVKVWFYGTVGAFGLITYSLLFAKYLDSRPQSTRRLVDANVTFFNLTENTHPYRF